MEDALLSSLPRTFRPALAEPLSQWELLFPAERRLVKARLAWLGALPPLEFQRLFEPIRKIESRMNLKGAANPTIEGTAILARSPLYPQWRAEIEKVFERMDGVLALPQWPRLIVCVLPGGLPLAGTPLWPDLAGSWIPLDAPFGEMKWPLLASLAARELPPGLDPIESAWVLESEPPREPLPATILCWTALATIRREFLNRLNAIQKSLKSADEASTELKRLPLAGLLEPALHKRAEVREFLRGLLLSGNGSLVFNNSFVQWGASETLRRVQPQVLIAAFGIRPKPKPFSSIVLFEDQARRNPQADQPDRLGSLIDGLKLSEYVYLAARRLAPYSNRTLTILAASDLASALVLAPEAARPAVAALPARAAAADLARLATHWLGAAA